MKTIHLLILVPVTAAFLAGFSAGSYFSTRPSDETTLTVGQRDVTDWELLVPAHRKPLTIITRDGRKVVIRTGQTWKNVPGAVPHNYVEPGSIVGL